ncbi:1,4-alpha-glucan branching protein GlgB [Tissierella sp. Yu-01]|uniref:1,4-alpha-glucan branching protein GlgB n=1 Tax=Tissierella sp. Yu-01 TaxID=3035694 RepID=UPI00240D1E21|nr:1,4-alpha-glucan branching protein GlgB [Tissierella sp. Yu-01]WFA08496.1 1,4-alpha-glucan branching protein GlgB [Tissierella sp. Yu-01]
MDFRSYEFLGAHKTIENGKEKVQFTVWAPNAKEVYLTGDFNDWNEVNLPLKKLKDGLWSIIVDDVKEFDSYKYRIIFKNNKVLYKADPYAFHAENPPKTASKYYDIKGFKWKDEKWMSTRDGNLINKPLNIYEVNLYSWKQKPNGDVYSYVELADELIPYVKEMGYTHIELLPIMEHPFNGSWGYQTTGYFAPTSRYGTPKDFMYFIDKCHRKGIGVILDWVPAHFCKDEHGLMHFDGGPCYESADTIKAENEQWGTLNFDYSKAEVTDFLISNAMYWHEYYHIDGLRIDAVAYMLYLNSTGKDIKNEYGGYENLEAIEFIKKLNKVIFQNFPHTMMIAEESTAWPLVTHPIHNGGLGFNYKWNMGWMNDILEYMQMDPIYRKDHQTALTFTMTYAFSENFVLPLSHDEVVHGKKSLLNKMPGDYKDKFSGLKLLYQYMFAHPGKKLLFMGGEFGQFIEWNEYKELDWHLLEYEMHHKLRKFVIDLNKLYKKEDSLYSIDDSFDGYKWIEHTNHQESIIAFERIGKDGDKLIAIFNFTPVPRAYYPIGVDEEGEYKTILNSDHVKYGGSTKRNKSYKTINQQIHERKFTIRVNLPGLGGLYLRLKKDQTNGRGN